jgi:L-aminopeptidase/D-esterase-like protein
MADDGLSRAIVPSHTAADGDTVFSLATGSWQGRADVTTVGALAADVLAEAIVPCCRSGHVLWRPSLRARSGYGSPRA